MAVIFPFKRKKEQFQPVIRVYPLFRIHFFVMKIVGFSKRLENIFISSRKMKQFVFT